MSHRRWILPDQALSPLAAAVVMRFYVRGTAMPAYILTGAPGSGKTAILRKLETLGYLVVEEAATDVIALENALGRDEPWQEPGFTDKIVALQRQRRERALADRDGRTVFFDRSPVVCKLALSRYLGFAPSHLLAREVDRVRSEGFYEKTVFFIRNQGFVQATAARRISFADSLTFERVHEETYRSLGFRLLDITAGPLPDRVALIERAVEVCP
jgi:predicted ATPase